MQIYSIDQCPVFTFWNGETYLLNFVLPNVYFHVTTAYAILRHNGVVLGKRDYLGALRVSRG